MHLKPILRGIVGVTAALLCLVLFVPHAHADEARINITATPTELADSGSVLFTFEIANYNADYPMTDVTISNNDTICYQMNDQSIPQSGSARDIKVTLNISQSQLGKPITFVVNWVRNGEPMSQEASITVQQAENPIISVSRTASTTNAKPGDSVVLTYLVKNPTKFDMSDITLIDENMSDNPILQLDSLRASSSYSIDYTYTMGEESVTSTPFVTYTVNGKTKTFSSLDPLELVMVRIQLDLKISAGTPTQNGVTFTIDVANSGTQAISNISIADERANLVNSTPFSLAPGESTTFSYIVVPLMSEPLRSVQFVLNGTDSFGNAYSLAPADIYEVYPYVDASQISVTVRAETITPWTSASGTLSARIVITNHSTVELTSITVLETTIGVIKNFDTLSAGTTSFDLEIQLGSPRNLAITVKGYDPTGTNRELASCVMPVAYGTETAMEETATPVPSSGNMTMFNGLMSGVAKILVVLAVLMVISFIILVALMAMERSKAPRLINEEDDDLDDYFEEPTAQASKTRQKSYNSEPDDEEISYTKRMLASQTDNQKREASEPIRLPPPAVVAEPKTEPPRPQPFVNSEPKRRNEQSFNASPQHTFEQESRFARPSEPTAPLRQPAAQTRVQTPLPTKTKTPLPRVYDYKKQAKTQPIVKRSVTHVTKSGNYNEDEDE